ncbi:MAG: GIY-YIG nuclease family protein [Caldilineaceae bacterium]
MKYTIYALSDSRTPHRYRYIGQTSRELDIRLREHLADKSVTDKTAWIAEVVAAGRSIKIEALAVVESPEKANSVEKDLIQQYEKTHHLLTNSSHSQRPAPYRKPIWMSDDLYTPELESELERMVANRLSFRDFLEWRKTHHDGSLDQFYIDRTGMDHMDNILASTFQNPAEKPHRSPELQVMRHLYDTPRQHRAPEQPRNSQEQSKADSEIVAPKSKFSKKASILVLFTCLLVASIIFLFAFTGLPRY